MTNKNSKTYLLSMIRNDGDIIEAFLNHALSLFDEIMLVDVHSTDGTSEILSEYAKQNSNIKVYSIYTQEKFQSAMMNTLARRAFDDGADWIFFLDADEFLNVPSKLDLLSGLNKISSPVIHIPWINLVPSNYGTFADFDISQIYYWTGRVSKYNKIAVNASYISLNPDFYIHEGNHEISPSLGSDLEPINFKFSILHLPIRSFDRLRYKILIAWRTLLTKTNRLPGEGDHVIKIKEMIDRGILGVDELNYLSAYYGDFGDQVKPILLSATGWPKVEIYNYKNNNEYKILNKRSIQETQLLDLEQSWITTNFDKKDIAMAVIENETELKIIPSPMRGDGVAYRESFKRLEGVNPRLPSQINAHSIISALDASFIKVDEMPFSAWSELVPALYAMFSFFKPRRYVELGSHYGMSFFAACQATQHLDLAAECIAVDSWVGDVHAGYHSTEVFDSFKSTIASKYPNQFYIKGFFSEALKSFEDGSVDLLHIDGYHTYEAVKDDFETWQPKMSNNGVVIFHDINVFERGFGVWRYWKELTEHYPNFHLSHMHGLGILYVGDNKTVISDFFEIIQKNTQYGIIVQNYFQSIGKLAITSRASQIKLEVIEPENSKLKIENQSLISENLSLISENLNLKNKIQFSSDCICNTWGLKQKATLRNFLVKIARYFNHAKDARVIKNSKLFDVNFYLDNNNDVKNARIDPVLHYLKNGAFELRNPSALFNTKQYLSSNPDVLLSGMNPLVHYIKFGKFENRQCC
jgi:hypothetical protein